MADFRDKRVRKLFEPGALLQLASPEDLALVIAVCRTLLRASMARVEQLAESDHIVLDPLPSKPAPQSDEAED